jgi:serine/threonine-protein kinase
MPTSARECPSCHTPLPAEAQFCFRCGHATPTEPGVPPRIMPTGEIEVAKVREVLADRYRIERVVGEGGMATVYLAEDLKHRRKVAVKVMRPELAATVGGDRFLREVEIAAQLNHPHILPMHDSGDANGVLYYVMPYVEGESLARRLAREGELPVRDALRIAREVAEALAYAHRRGIVHRDIKPANILVNEGHALVADFGIARALHSDGMGITATGLAIGTPQYMSPEQATGGREVDGRTDVYALGAVLYEMLSGEPPFTGRTPQAVVARMMTERPRALTATREGLPPAVEAVVMRALARSPADRYDSAEELGAALAQAEQGAQTPASPAVPAAAPAAAPMLWPALVAAAMIALLAVAFFAGRWGLPSWVLGMAVALLAAGGVMLALTSRAERSRRAGQPSAGLARLLTWRNTALGGVAALIVWAAVASAASAGRTDGGGRVIEGTHVAVLPFQNQGDSADNYIVDGITDEVRGKLARVSGLAVIASGSSGQYRGSSLTPAAIASELGAEYLLLGRVRWAGTGTDRRVQVVSELVDGATGETRWQQSFEAPLTDVFDVQAQIAARVAGALGTQLGTQETRAFERRPTVSPAAWDAYLKGRAITAIDPRALREAVGYFEQAVALDSTFVEAWAGLSMASARLYSNGDRSPVAAQRSGEAYRKALAIAPDQASGHAAEALYHTMVQGDAEQVARSIATALQLAPNDPDVLATAGRSDVNSGRVASGILRLERARELDPRSATINADLQRAYLAGGRLREAVEVGEAAVAKDPSNPAYVQFLAMAHAAAGDLEAAQAASRRSLENGMSPPVLAAYYAGFFEVTWLLDSASQALVSRLSPAAFDGDRAWWGQALATHHWVTGRPDVARVFADSALAPSRAQVRASPGDGSLLTLYGLMLAYAGQKDSAIAAGRLGVDMGGPAEWFNRHYNRVQLVRIYLAVGEPDLAINELETLMNERFYVTRAWLRIDPLYASLRDNPRFRRLVGGT